MILDTNFLILLERETRRRVAGDATAFLLQAAGEDFCISPTIEGEMACGLTLSNRSAWETFLLPFRRLAHSREVSWRYGEVYRELSARGRLIGSNDMWIAAVALAYDLPVVTRNVEEFKRVNGVQVMAF
jgi:predicted nucleic acid-binding protein